MGCMQSRSKDKKVKVSNARATRLPHHRPEARGIAIILTLPRPFRAHSAWLYSVENASRAKIT